MEILTIWRKETLIPLGMFPWGGAGQTRRQPLTSLTFLPLAFKDFYYQMPPIQGLELPPNQIVHTTLKNGKGEMAPNQGYKTSIWQLAIKINNVLWWNRPVEIIFLRAKTIANWICDDLSHRWAALQADASDQTIIGPRRVVRLKLLHQDGPPNSVKATRERLTDLVSTLKPGTFKRNKLIISARCRSNIWSKRTSVRPGHW